MIRYFTAGESHGPALSAIVEGMPAGVTVTLEGINAQLARRQQGHGRGGRMKIETPGRGAFRHTLWKNHWLANCAGY